MLTKKLNNTNKNVDRKITQDKRRDRVNILKLRFERKQKERRKYKENDKWNANIRLKKKKERKKNKERKKSKRKSKSKGNQARQKVRPKDKKKIRK